MQELNSLSCMVLKISKVDQTHGIEGVEHAVVVVSERTSTGWRTLVVR